MKHTTESTQSDINDTIPCFLSIKSTLIGNTSNFRHLISKMRKCKEPLRTTPSIKREGKSPREDKRARKQEKRRNEMTKK